MCSLIGRRQKRMFQDKRWLKREDILQFVLARKRQSGGFAMTPLLPASLEDTYHAVKILKILAHPIPSSTKAYIASLRWSDYYLPKNLYQLAILYQAMEQVLPTKELSETIRCILKWKKLSLEHLTYLARLLKLLNLGMLKATLCQRISFDRWRVLKELYHIMDCTQVCHISLPQKAASWVKQCQNGDGGFGFMPHTSSFLENTYYALKLMLYLKTKPENIRQCRQFIRYCYVSSRGGFARSPGGVVLLESTYHGLSALKMLEIAF